jgi:hypothetical protein
MDQSDEMEALMAFFAFVQIEHTTLVLVRNNLRIATLQKESEGVYRGRANIERFPVIELRHFGAHGWSLVELDARGGRDPMLHTPLPFDNPTHITEWYTPPNVLDPASSVQAAEQQVAEQPTRVRVYCIFPQHRGLYILQGDGTYTSITAFILQKTRHGSWELNFRGRATVFYSEPGITNVTQCVEWTTGLFRFAAPDYLFVINEDEFPPFLRVIYPATMDLNGVVLEFQPRRGRYRGTSPANVKYILVIAEDTWKLMFKRPRAANYVTRVISKAPYLHPWDVGHVWEQRLMDDTYAHLPDFGIIVPP